MIRRHGVGAHLVGDAQPPEVLHAAPIGNVHLRMTRGGGIAFHQERCDAAMLELVSEHEAHRSSARDQHRRLDHGRSPDFEVD